jgi:hypothetical protein
LSFLYAGIIDHTIWLNWFDHTQFNILINYCIYFAYKMAIVLTSYYLSNLQYFVDAV